MEILYGREFWGEWIRMDTGDRYYFSNNSLTINGQIRPLQGTITKESKQVIVGQDGSLKYWLYASRPATASFTGRVADQRQAAAGYGRAVSIGSINVVMQHCGKIIIL